MIKLTLKDGSVREMEKGLTVYDAARGIGEGLARVSLAGEVDGEVKDLRFELDRDCSLSLLTFKEDGGKTVYWHTASHILAQAVKRLYPGAKLAIGPAIENGFYYDFDLEQTLSTDDLSKIEAEMQKIIKEDLKIERFSLSRPEAIRLMKEKGEIYKVELIEELPGGEEISFYRQGDFVDLCLGPHLLSTGGVKAVKLLSVSGAYWRGSEKNKMLQRIYGIAFPGKGALEEHLRMLEEARKRDHNIIGRELELFTTSDVVGQGLPLFMPRGAKILQVLQRFVEDEEEKRGYQLTRTPYMGKSDLYKISGHWDHYRDGMFIMGDEERDEDVLALRPMTCPFQFMIYKSKQRSYRNLPVRYTETSPLFRNELSGEMHGLIRVRQFTLADAHIICTPEQLEDEFRGVIDLINYIMECIGIKDDVWFRFSKRDDSNEKYIDNPEAWETTQAKMKDILDRLDINYREAVGEAAFYGPKLDLQFKNVHGKEDTLFTVQIDFALPERFDMTYVDSDGEKKRPFVIHRSSIGCYERTLALLIEKYAGAFPTWLAPVQAKIIPVSEKYLDYAGEVKKMLEQKNIRCEIDGSNEKVGYKIRIAQLEKVPYMLVVGEEELKNATVSIRSRKEGVVGSQEVYRFMLDIVSEVTEKRIN